jgi:hypothetical protein
VSDIRFSYRIVGKRKDISGHQRFPKFDPRASMPVARARTARRVQPARRGKIPRPTPDGLRAFAARMEKEAGVPCRSTGADAKGPQASWRPLASGHGIVALAAIFAPQSAL